MDWIEFHLFFDTAEATSPPDTVIFMKNGSPYVSAILLHTGYLIRPFSPEFTRTAEKAHSLFFNYSNGILASKNYVGVTNVCTET